MAQTASRFSGPIDQEWLDRHSEPLLDPGLPIIDPHHHLWMRDGNVYLLPELPTDIASGHNVIATVFEECHSMYRTTGPEEEQSLGGTGFVTGVGAMGVSGVFGTTKTCARMVGRVDLAAGDRARPLLEHHLIASGGRFARVRQSTAWDDQIHKVVPTQGMLLDATFRAGFAALSTPGLVFDAWVYHPRPGEVADLAGKFPNTQIVLNHVGSPILGGPYAADRAKVFSAWRPWLETSIALFGADRCMFESHFPVQKRWCSYQVVWNAFKRIAANASSAEKAALFAGTAARVYGVPAA